MSSPKTAIVPTRSENYPEWYQQVIRAADLAETSATRGCMVIKPWGYALWKKMQAILDARFKATGHQNIYCPLLIPLSFLEKEAEHVSGFAKECAVVTHHRLEADDAGKLHPAAPLEEPMVIRPTSETVIGDLFSKWVQSYRDLPLLVNQWANVMRWEMRTRLFLRTSEFLWQEGHTVHASAEAALTHTQTMLQEYVRFAEDVMAMPVYFGEKTAAERFPGAEKTYCIEAMMQDGKALQAGTSHFLGQNFAKAQDIRYLNEAGEHVLAWTTSWGVSTRLIGGLIMTHSDDDGLVLPPRLAPQHVVILPIVHEESVRNAVMQACRALQDALQATHYAGEPVRVLIDDKPGRAGNKAWRWVKKGVPIRIEIGPKDLEKGQVCLKRRDKAVKDKQFLSHDACVKAIPDVLVDMQQGLFDAAKQRLEEQTYAFDTKEAFEAFLDSGQPGFARLVYRDDPAVEAEWQTRYNVTARCVVENGQTGDCVLSGTPGGIETIFARAY